MVSIIIQTVCPNCGCTDKSKLHTVFDGFSCDECKAEYKVNVIGGIPIGGLIKVK